MHTSGAPGLRPTLPEWAVVSPARREHIERVAALAGRWALEMGIPDSERHRWLRAVWLHDALRDAPPEELARLAPTTAGPAELRHGPASAARAKAEGETDRGVLDAVRYHSIGLAEWDMVGRILYCADYLEPGRKQEREWRAELAERLPTEPALVLRQVARARLLHTISSGRPLLEPTVRFWNSLLAAGSASS
jgi:HD superfamily phosphohydrolase YqeK